ncbi:MAG: SRPBCC domain-containing protein [Bacteroidetes bacterium]|nr:SRPBCC domain-containing protein [Bacteroidota bacterium]
MNNKSFQFAFSTSVNSSTVFTHLINPENWWVGLFGETIEGKSNEINDEFTFKAGDGVHYSVQRLIESVPGSKIVWLVTESNLSFLKKTNEWAGTKICFDLDEAGNKTSVTFTHIGLIPEIECYGSCSSAWTQYLKKLEAQLSTFPAKDS